MSFKLNLLKLDPIPEAKVLKFVPGVELLRSVKILDPASAFSLASVTVDAPPTATFNKYRSILFKFNGVGFSNSTATNLLAGVRKSSIPLTGTAFYQANQISSASATGWVNTSVGVNVIPLTAGTPLTNNFPLENLEILISPTGFDANLTIDSGTTLPAGSIAKTIASFPLIAGGIVTPIALEEYPGVTLTLSAANFFTAWNYAGAFYNLPLTCDVYGYVKS
jgi:hypothetical protein